MTPAGLVAAPTTALIVVDVQNGFVNDRSQRAIPNLIRLIDHWRSSDRPVYFTKFLNQPGSKWERLIGWTRLRDSPEIDFHESVRDLIGEDEVVDKRNLYTSVTGRLERDVRNGAVKDAVVCGIATESCVLATALRLFEIEVPDVRPFVVRDASASHAGEPAHDAGITVIERFIGRGQVLTTDEVIAAG